MSGDLRVVYGARCAWWDTIDKAGAKPSGLPCCPHCGGVLLEVPSERQWWAGVNLYTTVPNYPAFIAWLRGQCFPNLDVALAAFEAAGSPAPDLDLALPSAEELERIGALEDDDGLEWRVSWDSGGMRGDAWHRVDRVTGDLAGARSQYVGLVDLIRAGEAIRNPRLESRRAGEWAPA